MTFLRLNLDYIRTPQTQLRQLRVQPESSQNRWGSAKCCAHSKPMQSLVKPGPCLVTCLCLLTDYIYICVCLMSHHYATILHLSYVQLSICHSLSLLFMSLLTQL